MAKRKLIIFNGDITQYPHNPIVAADTVDQFELDANPTEDMQVATKKYVDDSYIVTVFTKTGQIVSSQDVGGDLEIALVDGEISTARKILFSSGDGTDANPPVFGGLQTSDIPDNAITQPKINDGAVTTSKIADLAVTNAKIASSAIDNSKVAANAAIDYSKLAALTANTIVIADSSGHIVSSTANGYGKLTSGVPTYYTVIPRGDLQTMTGASAGAAGESGAVPQPLAGDNTKFLRGDGTFASPPNSVNYSTSEQSTGVQWIDGKTIYFKTISTGARAANGSYVIDSTLKLNTYIDTLINIDGCVKDNANTSWFVQRTSLGSSAFCIVCYATAVDGIKLDTGSSINAITSGYVIVYYTKV